MRRRTIGFDAVSPPALCEHLGRHPASCVVRATMRGC
jgi:hypothetical protein